MGGFHLSPAPPEIADQTVAALREIDPGFIMPMHCTGAYTVAAIARDVPAKLIMPSVGTRVIFGA